MKKLFLTSAIIAVMSYPAIALDANNHIEPGSANDCVESTLGTATGPANLEADWNANTINLEWYNEDTKLTVPTTSNTCTYDGGITLPSTNPTKTGYTFRGWQVRSAQCILPSDGMLLSVTTTWDAQHARWKPINGDSGNTMQSAFGTENSSDLNNGEWAVTFSYGTLKGVALCSTTDGAYANTGTPNESGGGEYCWCKGTGIAEPNSTEYCPVASFSWVFRNNNYTADACANRCADKCAADVQDMNGYRLAVFGQ